MDHPSVLPLAETWRSRAKECRAASTRLRCADARTRMLAAARDFERLAMDEKGGPPQHREWIQRRPDEA